MVFVDGVSPLESFRLSIILRFLGGGRCWFPLRKIDAPQLVDFPVALAEAKPRERTLDASAEFITDIQSGGSECADVLTLLVLLLPKRSDRAVYLLSRSEGDGCARLIFHETEADRLGRFFPVGVNCSVTVPVVLVLRPVPDLLVVVFLRVEGDGRMLAGFGVRSVGFDPGYELLDILDVGPCTINPVNQSLDDLIV